MAKKTPTKASSKRPATKKTASPKKKAAKKKPAAGEIEATIDRRRSPRRNDAEAERAEATPAPKLERRKKVNRRRQIDPTTCERDYSDAEVEFMNALDEYKRASGRMFPTCSEVLEVVRSLGYVQLSPAERTARAEEAAGNSIEDRAEAEADEALTLSEELQAEADASETLV